MHHIVPIGAKFDFQPLDASNLVLRLHPVSQSVIFHLTYTHMSSEQCKVLTTAQYGPKPLAILRFIKSIILHLIIRLVLEISKTGTV